jgi:hypothetical protein
MGRMLRLTLTLQLLHPGGLSSHVGSATPEDIHAPHRIVRTAYRLWPTLPHLAGDTTAAKLPSAVCARTNEASAGRVSFAQMTMPLEWGRYYPSLVTALAPFP